MSPRDPHRTRAALLQAAHEQIHRVGFQAASLDEIPAAAGVTKGALYYHFKNKSELGRAVIREILGERMIGKFEEALQAGPDPITALQTYLVETQKQMGDAVVLGCPVNNLAQEMSSLDEGLRSEIARLYALWEGVLVDALRSGIEGGSVRPDLDPNDTALFIVGAIEGAMGLTKSLGDPKALDGLGRALIAYLDTLRAVPAETNELEPAATA